MHDTVLIYQMGKVGSTTVSATLDSMEIKNSQIHFLNPERLNAIACSQKEKGLPHPHHIDRSLKILEENMLSCDNLKIITLVRDPIARNVSSYFQNLGMYWGGGIQGIPSKELVKDFILRYAHHNGINWFHDEFNPSLGIDIFDVKHDKKSPSFRFQKNNFDILLLKAEASDDQKKSAISEFVGKEGVIDLVQGNVGSDKSYKNEYSDFKDSFICPYWYKEIMYKSEFVKFFYSADEIKHMRSKWT